MNGWHNCSHSIKVWKNSSFYHLIYYCCSTWKLSRFKDSIFLISKVNVIYFSLIVWFSFCALDIIMFFCFGLCLSTISTLASNLWMSSMERQQFLWRWKQQCRMWVGWWRLLWWLCQHTILLCLWMLRSQWTRRWFWLWISWLWISSKQSQQNLPWFDGGDCCGTDNYYCFCSACECLDPAEQGNGGSPSPPACEQEPSQP